MAQIELNRLSDVVGRSQGQLLLMSAESRARLTIATNRRWLVPDAAGRFRLSPEGERHDAYFVRGRS